MAAPFGAAINYALCILNYAFFTALDLQALPCVGRSCFRSKLKALDLQQREPYRPHYPRTS